MSRHLSTHTRECTNTAVSSVSERLYTVLGAGLGDLHRRLSLDPASSDDLLHATPLSPLRGPLWHPNFMHIPPPPLSHPNFMHIPPPPLLYKLRKSAESIRSLQTRHQTRVLCGCTTFGTESN